VAFLTGIKNIAGSSGFTLKLTSEYAVKVYGQGHVVAHNYIAHWHRRRQSRA
jgi:hypothetical protein